MKQKFLKTLSVSLMLAISFTFFCCSSDDKDSNESAIEGTIKCGEKEMLSSDECVGGEIVRKCRGQDYFPDYEICDETGNIKDKPKSSSSIKIQTSKEKITGVSQKGPFVVGSTVTIYELDENLSQTGQRTYRSTIIDDKGTFEIKDVQLASSYVLLEADGFYRNEVSGEKSVSRITLNAIADISDKSNINVNLLTHLEYDLVLDLVKEGKSFAEAKKQAQQEILSAFGITGNFENSENMSIFGTDESDAALLAISILLQGERKEADFSELLTEFAQAIKKQRKWEDNVKITEIADWARFTKLEDIRNNILAWGLSSEVPAFEKYVRNFWYLNYGLGVCDVGSEGVVKNNANKFSKYKGAYFICKRGIWISIGGIAQGNYSLWGADADMFPLLQVITPKLIECWKENPPENNSFPCLELLTSWYGDANENSSTEVKLNGEWTIFDKSVQLTDDYFSLIDIDGMYLRFNVGAAISSDSLSFAGIAFDFYQPEGEDISSKGGYCLTYTSDNPVKLELGWDEAKYGYDTWYVTLPVEPNGKTISLPWTKFRKDGWEKDIRNQPLETALKEAKSLKIMYKDFPNNTVVTNFVLNGLGWFGDCKEL